MFQRNRKQAVEILNVYYVACDADLEFVKLCAKSAVPSCISNKSGGAEKSKIVYVVSESGHGKENKRINLLNSKRKEKLTNMDSVFYSFICLFFSSFFINEHTLHRFNSSCFLILFHFLLVFFICKCNCILSLF